MTTKNAIVHFEIPADDVERAQRFYTDTFGWEIKQFPMPEGDPYYFVVTTPMDEQGQPLAPGAINGGMMKRRAEGQPFMNYINVDSIDETIAVIRKNGGTIALPKTEIAPGMGWIAAFQDTERNLIGLHEMSAEAKAKAEE